MRRRSVDSKVELHLITAMITSTEYLSQVATGVSENLFKAEHLRLIAKWCIGYFVQYREAPGKHIESIYSAWSEEAERKPEEIEPVHDLLSAMSERYEDTEPVNVPYLVDETAKWATTRKLDKIREELEYHLSQGNVEAAEAAVSGYSSCAIGVGHGIDVLNNTSAWETAFAENQQTLIKMGDPDGDRFLSRALTRDSLIAIQGPEKRGKTWWCVEFAVRALMNRRKVAFFEVGDMSESQIMKRFGARFSMRPINRSECGVFQLPIGLEKNGAVVDVFSKEVEILKPVRIQSCQEGARKFMRKNGITPKAPYLMLSVHPNSSINVAGIESILDKWEVENDFIPDVVLIDYPDILAPEPDCRGMDTRDQINTTWKALRRLSQERHILAMVPTQANAASYQAEVLDMSNFSEDKRKLAHVTGMLGLNQTTEEKGKGLMRLNWIVLRESPFSSHQCLTVAQCLSLGRAYCGSIL